MVNTFKIEPAQFMLDPAIEKIFSIISEEGGNIKFVGGCIRDLILEQKAQDIDLATDLEPNEIISILDENGISHIKDNAIQYGTVTALIENIYLTKVRKIEITSLRKDIETFGRQANVEFTKDFEEDANRRDFTINALYADLDGTIYDFFGSYQDLLDKRLVFIGEPEERIKEDFLRILRYFRFYATLEDFQFDDKSLDACVKYASSLKELSGERIFKELRLILSSKNPALILEFMSEEGLLKHILTKATDFEILKNLVWIENNAKVLLPNFALSSIRRLATIIDNTEDAHNIAGRLKLSNAQKLRLTTLVSAPFEVFSEMENCCIRQILHTYGAEIFQDIVLLKWAKERLEDGKTNSEDFAKWYDLLETASLWRPLEFGIRGQDVLEKGVPEGVLVGEILCELETWWQNNDFKPEREELLSELDTIILKHKKDL